jgi:hypothetical protein
MIPWLLLFTGFATVVGVYVVNRPRGVGKG